MAVGSQTDENARGISWVVTFAETHLRVVGEGIHIRTCNLMSLLGVFFQGEAEDLEELLCLGAKNLKHRRTHDLENSGSPLGRWVSTV